MTLSFSELFMRREDQAVEALQNALIWDDLRAERVRKKAVELVHKVRGQKQGPGQLEAFLKDYGLDTEEGLALMALAEALLRIPDKATANALIRDKIAAADWRHHHGGAQDPVVKVAGLGLFLTSKTLDGALGRMSEPFIREAMLRAMQVLGKQFVLGTDIENAANNAAKLEQQNYRLSYDILGEGARTAEDAERYFKSYAHAIQYIGVQTKAEKSGAHWQRRPGISVKLSALHPRYELAQAEICVPEMIERLGALARLAAAQDLALTVDAEETARLSLSLQIIEGALDQPELAGWEGFGLAVQAYHKGALAVIDHVAAMSQRHHRRLQVRLVKGAYWDSEIKKAQVAGLADFPVYTRKAHTDMSYLACAHKLFAHADRIYPMLATHNAHSVAAILELGRENRIDYEFQRLFGMGQALFATLLKEEDKPASVYAPVGPHADLLPYLVRRLLENGANSSFVHRLLDHDASVEELVADPVDKIKKQGGIKHPKIMLPQDLFTGEKPQGRRNSAGLDLSAPAVVAELQQEMRRHNGVFMAAPLIGGRLHKEGVAEEIRNPGSLSDLVGKVYAANDKVVDLAFEMAQRSFAEWAGLDADIRAQTLERAADLLEAHRTELMMLCVREAGKTIPDALAEIREAADFCRYYAVQGRVLCAAGGTALPGPTGESNRLSLHGRGTFVCISPWNFPLAIFTGQIAAALMAGNCVIAKPAEQTPLIAMRMAQLLHEAGVPPGALALLPGDGRVGAMLVAHPDVAGVAFTGSTAAAKDINQTLAGKDGPIVPLIAETGGQNAMVVDSSALPEQVADDVIQSAFGSAGQRCSALRILCLQEDVADKIIVLLQGAMQELNVGNPFHLSSDLGPVIDENALAMLRSHREALGGFGRFVYETPLDADLKNQGHYFGPCIYELQDLKGLTKEVFGPILHILRYRRAELDEVLQQIAATGYGLTLGVHSRIQGFHDYVTAKLPAGNVYVNRSMIGAVVGTQPFGGLGLSGTGPKAGGPHYLARFAHEKAVSVNTAAAGGNASLVSLSE